MYFLVGIPKRKLATNRAAKAPNRVIACAQKATCLGYTLARGQKSKTIAPGLVDSTGLDPVLTIYPGLMKLRNDESCCP